MLGLIIARYLRRDRSLKHHPSMSSDMAPQRQDSAQRRPAWQPEITGRERVRPNLCFIMALMAAISASSASAQLDRLGAGALGQLPYALFEGVRAKFIAP